MEINFKGVTDINGYGCLQRARPRDGYDVSHWSNYCPVLATLLALADFTCLGTVARPREPTKGEHSPQKREPNLLRP